MIMQENNFIQLALNLQEPWFVKETRLNTTDNRLDIYLDFSLASRPIMVIMVIVVISKRESM